MITGDNNTCDKYLPISTTPGTVISGDNDTGDNIFPRAINTGQKYPKSLKFIAAKKLFSGVNHTANKTALTIPACI
jgi:hypothetical protein